MFTFANIKFNITQNAYIMIIKMIFENSVLFSTKLLMVSLKRNALKSGNTDSTSLINTLNTVYLVDDLKET